MKITLITCTYNAAEVLQRTLDSVRIQRYANIEHLIIDGKSKDDTVGMAQQYKTRSNLEHTGHTIIIHSEPDRGLYDAMNKGIAKATGDYLCFLNAGDVLPSADTLADIVAKAEKSGEEYGVIYGETDVVDNDGKFLYHRRLKAPKTLTWRSFRHGMLVCHQAFYANTSIAKQTQYNMKYRISADVDWCIRIMKEGNNRGLKNLNVGFVVDNYLAGGMSVKNHRKSLIERFQTMREHYGLLDTIMMHMWFVVRQFIVHSS